METPQLTDEQIEILRDEQTVFALAVMAVEINVGTLLRDKNKTTIALLKIGNILKSNPGFTERFRKVQKMLIEQMQKKGSPAPDSDPLPTDIALGLADVKKPVAVPDPIL